MNYKLNYSDELYHHGIKGMKWGIRRYQNEDGSLTPEGKVRYNKSEETKDYAKRLNAIDKRLANDRYTVDDSKFKVFSKATEAEKAEARKNIANGEKEVKQIIKEATKAGYSVQSKEVARAATAGKAIADEILLASGATLGLQVLGIPMVVLGTGNNYVSGKKYRVGEEDKRK